MESKVAPEEKATKSNQCDYLMLHYRQNVNEYLRVMKVLVLMRVEFESIVFVMILTKIKNSRNILSIDQLE
jgi:hypothetical protein